MQHVASIFDNTLERLKGLEHTYTIASAANGQFKYTKSTDRSLAVFGFKNINNRRQLYAIWMDEAIPAESNVVKLLDFTFSNGDFENPVLVDIITGGVYEIPAGQWSKTGTTYTFKNIPVYDAPVLIADKSLLHLGPL